MLTLGLLTGSESKFRKPLFHLLTSGLVTKLCLHKGVFSHDSREGRSGTSFYPRRVSR